MNKHTPGPWSWDAGLVPPDGPSSYADIFSLEHETIVASFNDCIPEGTANAHLIAAAPDLLSALHGLLGLLDERDASDRDYCEICERRSPRDDEGYPTDALVHADTCEIGIAEAAVAKAEGRS